MYFIYVCIIMHKEDHYNTELCFISCMSHPISSSSYYVVWIDYENRMNGDKPLQPLMLKISKRIIVLPQFRLTFLCFYMYFGQLLILYVFQLYVPGVSNSVRPIAQHYIYITQTYQEEDSTLLLYLNSHPLALACFFLYKTDKRHVPTRLIINYRQFSFIISSMNLRHLEENDA